jgi:transposase
MLASIRCDGTTACMVIEGPTDGAVFCAYLRQVLLPTLRSGDCVIMDNLSVHKIPLVETLLVAAGVHVRWLPAYSPDLNPIEKMWSKIKTLLRTAKARTADALQTAIALAFQAVTPQDAINWFASCGYTFI